MEPVRSDATLVTAEGEVPTSEMRLNLKDGRRFIHYLRALENQLLEPTQIETLVEVAKILTTQLATEYNLHVPDERMLELFGALDDLIKEYTRLDPEGKFGLQDSVRKLAEYLAIARAGYLREYFFAIKGQLLDGVGANTFGPSEWHTDMMPENYTSRWQDASETVKNIRKNPKAADFSSRVIQNLKESITYALLDLPRRDYIKTEEASLIRSTLQKSLEELDAL